jgi:ankyrin repeat protein
MKEGKKIQIPSPEKKFRALIAACQKNDSVEVEKLLKEGISVNEIDSNRRSAIFHCIDHEDLSCLNLLIDAKADLNLKDKDGYSCLHLATINGNMKILEKLHKSNADINVFDGEMHTLVHWAVVCGHANILEYLLHQRCNSETPDIHGAFPLHYAAQMCGQIDVWDENILRSSDKSIILNSLK